MNAIEFPLGFQAGFKIPFNTFFLVAQIDIELQHGSFMSIFFIKLIYEKK